LSGESFGLALALSSGFLTALAHMLLKAGADRLALRTTIGLTCSACAAPFCLLVAHFPASALWLWLLAANGLHLLYQLILVRSYDANDFATAFPVARGVAPLGTALLGILLLGESASLATTAGAALVSLGIFAVVAARRVPTQALVLAVVTGLLTTAYTLVDARAIRLAPDALSFIAWFFALDGVFILVAFLAVRGTAMGPLVAEARTGARAGFATLACFGSALWALRLAPVGAVAGLRETSILFALLFARFGLGERVGPAGALGGATIAAGAVLILL
jgi:drug/metabolite transporter (DMT)-like permease